MSSQTEFRQLREFQSAPRCVLFLEDEPLDFDIALIQLKKVHLMNRVICVHTADEMLEYLRGMDSYLNAEQFPQPAVILIDQHLPGLDGLEAQQMLRSDLRFRRIPIIAISSPEQIPKLKTAVELGADTWMTKPFNGAEFRHIAQDLDLQLEFDHAALGATSTDSTKKLASQ